MGWIIPETPWAEFGVVRSFLHPKEPTFLGLPVLISLCNSLKKVP